MIEAEYLVERYGARLSAAIAATESRSVVALAEAVVETCEGGGTVLVAGNGGSASTASHFANDLTMVGVRAGRPMRVRSLTDCSALVTGIANDRSYEQILADQVGVSAGDRDLLLLISASGNSPNLLLACDQARRMGTRVGAIVGFDGGELGRRADITVHTPTTVGDYGVAEDAHMFVNHALAELLARRDA